MTNPSPPGCPLRKPSQGGLRAGTFFHIRDMDYSIRHIPAAGRFETQVEGYTGYVEYALLPQGVMDIRHTIVPKEIGGRGIAAALVKFALEYARSQGMKVRPSCWYAEEFLRRHPEYAAVLSEL